MAPPRAIKRPRDESDSDASGSSVMAGTQAAGRVTPDNLGPRAQENSSLCLPSAGKVYLIRHRDSGKFINIKFGCLNLGGPDPHSGRYWSCERQKGWIGFRETGSGLYFGSAGSFSVLSTSTTMQQFVVMPERNQGCYLQSISWPWLLYVGIDKYGNLTQLDSSDQAALWEFVEICKSAAEDRPSSCLCVNSLFTVDLVAMILIYLSSRGIGAVQGQCPVAHTPVVAVVNDKSAVGIARGAVVSLVAGVGMDFGTTVRLGLVACLVILLERATVKGGARAARKAVKLASVSRSSSREAEKDGKKLHFVRGLRRFGREGDGLQCITCGSLLEIGSSSRGSTVTLYSYHGPYKLSINILITMVYLMRNARGGFSAKDLTTRSLLHDN
ncbi:hypothetical protein NPX13_g1161 [Xylaria arbuscula]|uniref:Uncharacterized protein n=1 Tax=Xylaria arbuscula TaxID=114810 RepID=A0A9W8TS13_9PEZI|nr:hypothetical protein NPX13_g1161 [Xylaria arbuscula]